MSSTRILPPCSALLLFCMASLSVWIIASKRRKYSPIVHQWRLLYVVFRVCHHLKGFVEVFLTRWETAGLLSWSCTFFPWKAHVAWVVLPSPAQDTVLTEIKDRNSRHLHEGVQYEPWADGGHVSGFPVNSLCKHTLTFQMFLTTADDFFLFLSNSTYLHSGSFLICAQIWLLLERHTLLLVLCSQTTYSISHE